ncbi:hypothetical protein [Sphingomonas sp.]|uniref:hypothetical protein n=1 Tax=Sphingomonas sp. TaxID=28214 RepID=UPI0028B107D2|nr:hypothetical protein [Sphingomonas sp.]
MDDGSPMLEVGFSIDVADSTAAIAQLRTGMDGLESGVVRSARSIERVTSSMVDTSAVVAQINTFGMAVTRTEQEVRREKSRTEATINRMISTLERETLAVGRTREEQRAARIEELALAAARQGNTDAADRLLASTRALGLAQGALAEQKLSGEMKAEAAAARERAAAEAALNGQLLERSRLDAALARLNGTDRPTAAQGGATVSALAERERALELAEREAAVQREQNNLLAERASIQAALERTTGIGRTSATDAGATYSALAAKAAEDEARARDLAAAAVKREADEHAKLAALLRGSRDAEIADAAAAERMREATDPLYAAVKRLNGEIEESTRLYRAGSTAPAEYARQQEVLGQRLRSTTQQHEAMAVAGTANANAMRSLAIQMPDVVQGLLTGQKPFTILIQQGGQLVQVAMMAEGGLKAVAVAAGTLALYLAPLAVVAGVGYVALAKFQSSVKDSGELTRYRDGLGLTHKEMLQLSDGVDKAGDKIKQLNDVTVTAGDVMSGVWKTISEQLGKGGNWDGLKKGASEAFDWVIEAWNKTSAGITAGIYGTVNASKVIWGNFATSVGDVFYQAVNLAIGAMNRLVKVGTDILNGFVHAANKVPGVNIGAFKAPQMAEVQNPYAGAASRAAEANAWKAVGDGYKNAYAQARKEDAAFWAQVGTNAKKSAMDRMKAEADAIKANRTAPKPKVDRNALNSEAIEAQIKNLYKLADAYGVSGAAALIAEARVKGESDAIKRRTDVEAAVDRQVRLSIAQRVSDGAKSTAVMREQATIQAKVNAQVASGLVPASQAAEMVRGQIGDLPLLGAVQAAQAKLSEAAAARDVARQKEFKDAADKATQALGNQQRARAELDATKITATFNNDSTNARNRLAQLQAELAVIGQTDAVRAHELASVQALQYAEAQRYDTFQTIGYVATQVKIVDAQEQLRLKTDAVNDNLRYQADLFDLIAANVGEAASGMAEAFGSVGSALGDVSSRLASYLADQEKIRSAHKAQVALIASMDKGAAKTAAAERENARFALRTATTRVDLYGDMAGAAKGFFSENSKGYEILAATEKAYRAIQFAMSVRAMAQDVAETLGIVSNSAARATAQGTEGIASQSKLPFPFNIVAMAATAGALVAAGVAVIGSLTGGGHTAAPTNTGTGTGTVLGDSSAKSESLKRAIDELKAVDTVTNVYSRQILASLRSIDSQIGGVAAVIVRGGDINASSSVAQGFKPNLIGSVLGSIPLIGGLLGGLFGTRTDVTGSGIYGGAQSVGSVLNGGFNAQAYSDVTKTKKFLGIVSGRSYSTEYGALDPNLSNQFTLILRSFNDAIKAAAVPLGESTDAIQQRLNGFVVNIGKIDLKGLTGEQIQEKLNAVFGAAADNMATAAFPLIAQFQKVGEGAFETLTRVATTVEQVSTSLELLGASAKGMSIAAKLGLADQFDSVSALNDAATAYFQAFYTSEEQAAAKTAQMGKVFASLGVSVPPTLTAFRQLVEAQDLTTAAGQSTYATLLKLAPAFADLQQSLQGAKSAADIMSERQDLERQILELQGKTDEIRKLDLAKLDASNRALQLQVWAIQDAQEAAKAADELRQAWSSVGDSIMDEVKRIRGLGDVGGANTFAGLLGQFNAATAAARGGDQDAAKSLPQLSQALLSAAANAATSRQELARVQAQTAASLEATYGAINKLGTAAAVTSASAQLAAAATAQTAATGSNDNAATIASLQATIVELKDEVKQMRTDNNAGHAATAGNTGSINKKLGIAQDAAGGVAIATKAVA